MLIELERLLFLLERLFNKLKSGLIRHKTPLTPLLPSPYLTPQGRVTTRGSMPHTGLTAPTTADSLQSHTNIKALVLSFDGGNKEAIKNRRR